MSGAGTRWTGLAGMRSDLRTLGYAEMTRREKTRTWLTYYFPPTRRWAQKLGMWWAHKVLRYPPLPPIEKDRIALHHGFVEGVPPCTDGPVCAEHGWPLSPFVTGERDG